MCKYPSDGNDSKHRIFLWLSNDILYYDVLLIPDRVSLLLRHWKATGATRTPSVAVFPIRRPGLLL